MLSRTPRHTARYTVIATVRVSAIATQGAGSHIRHLLLEVAESAVLGAFEPPPISACNEDEFGRALRAIQRSRSSRFARFRDVVNRNAFLLACGDYTADRDEEHLLVGYGYRHGSTTKVRSLHHIIGEASSVRLPVDVGHAMWAHYESHEDNELLVFHNHPQNLVTLLLDNEPLASRADRRFLEARALQPEQIVRRLQGRGCIRFYIGENGFVKEFRLPSVLSLAARQTAVASARP
jgi:hypothetical protein